MKKQVKICLKKYRRNKDDKSRDNYVQKRKVYIKLRKEKKFSFYTENINSLVKNLNDQNAFWKHIKHILCLSPPINDNAIDIKDFYTFF